MPIAYATGKVAEIVYILKLFRFEDDVVIAEAVEFGEPWGHFGVRRLRRRLNWLAE